VIHLVEAPSELFSPTIVAAVVLLSLRQAAGSVAGAVAALWTLSREVVASVRKAGMSA
jgi:hypothetical protein